MPPFFLRMGAEHPAPAGSAKSASTIFETEAKDHAS